MMVQFTLEQLPENLVSVHVLWTFLWCVGVSLVFIFNYTFVGSDIITLYHLYPHHLFFFLVNVNIYMALH